MKNTTKIFASVVGVITLILQVPAVQTAIGAFIAAHPTFATIFASVAAILALIHNPAKE